MDKVRLLSDKRLGLELRDVDHLRQYIEYLKGLHYELEVGDFERSKSHYFDAIHLKTSNHRVRKATLKRLVDINIRMKAPADSPEKCMLQRYYIKRREVQVVMSTGSFNSIQSLKIMCRLPQLIYDSLTD